MCLCDLAMQLDAQAAGGGLAGVRMIGDDVLKDMDAVSARCDVVARRCRCALLCCLMRVQVVAKSTVGLGIGAL